MMSVSLPWASIVILPAVVVRLIAALPAAISSASTLPYDICPDPSVFKTWLAEPSACGQDWPSNTIAPDPLGAIIILLLLADIICFALTSRLPPSCGVVSSTMFASVLGVAVVNIEPLYVNTSPVLGDPKLICKAVPLPNAVYNSLKLSFTISPPARRVVPPHRLQLT